MKEYHHLLKDDPNYAERAELFSDKVKDISEFLVTLPLKEPEGRVEKNVAYDDPCHLIHGQKISKPPRQILGLIPGLKLVPLRESEACCGSAGIYNITHSGTSLSILEKKMDNIERSGAEIVATGNPGCLLQIRLGAMMRNLPIEVVHPIQLLDQAYRT